MRTGKLRAGSMYTLDKHWELKYRNDGAGLTAVRSIYLSHGGYGGHTEPLIFVGRELLNAKTCDEHAIFVFLYRGKRVLLLGDIVREAISRSKVFHEGN